MSPAKPFDRRAVDLPINAVVVPDEVDNPYAHAADAPDKIIVMRSLRGDPLGWMYHHRQIKLDDALYLAGRRWQTLYERSEIGGIRAFDPTKVSVDGRGPRNDPITDGHRRAVESLQRAEKVIRASTRDRHRGTQRVNLVIQILARGLFPAQIAVIFGYHPRKISREFKRSLEALAIDQKWQKGR